MKLPIIDDPRHSPELAAWAAKRIAHVGEGGFGPCWALGVVRARELAAVVVFHDWQPAAGTVQLSCAAETPRWASRAVVRELLGVAFSGRLGAPVRKVWTATPHRNERALKFNVGIGFKREAVLREHFAEKQHAVICSILASEYRKRYGGS